MRIVLAHASGWGLDEWGYVGAPLLLALAGVVALLVGSAASRAENGADVSGDRVLDGNGTGPGPGLVARLPVAVERLTGLPGWAGCVMMTGGIALVVALTGFLWDVAWHIDMGRDKQLFTPAHTMIVMGLGGIFLSGLVGIPFATATNAPVTLRVKSFRVPWTSLLLMAMGAGALMGFPLDDVWHKNYGVDVTLWGPTHVLMISGASLTTMALWLVCAEARISPRDGRGQWLVHWALAGAVLTGLSTGQGEFDFGVPQFQQLYHPVLLAIAAGCGLVAARLVLGRGGALAVAGFFVGIRCIVALVVGGALNLSVPRFPLYLGSVLAIELVAVALGTTRRLRFALVSGIGIATVGLGGDWLWTHAWGRHPWNGGLFPEAFLVGGLAAVGAAVLGVALGSVVLGTSDSVVMQDAAVSNTQSRSWWRRSHAGLRNPVIFAGCAAVVVTLLIPFPRRSAEVTASLTLDRRGDEAAVRLQLDPVDAAFGARWFEVIGWQGGGLVRSPMRATGVPGEYASEGTVPVTGQWKSLVRLHRGNLALGVPIYMPEDTEIDAPLIPAADREVPVVRDVDLLLREAHAGPVWPAVVAYGGIVTVGMSWTAVFLFVAMRLRRRSAPQLDSR